MFHMWAGKEREESYKNTWHDLKTYITRDFPGGPVVKTALPMQGTCVGSLIGELDTTCHKQDLAQPNK